MSLCLSLSLAVPASAVDPHEEQQDAQGAAGLLEQAQQIPEPVQDVCCAHATSTRESLCRDQEFPVARYGGDGNLDQVDVAQLPMLRSTQYRHTTQ